MLEDNKKLYYTCAQNNLPGWEEMSKSQLCEIYVNSDSQRVKEGAIAGIIYKSWNIFHHNYRNQPYIPIEDWYDSMIEAIMYVLKNHVWTNPKNILFNKPNGPEMALHRCICSRKINIYCLNHKPKRVINLNIGSTEDLKERAGVDPSCEIDDDSYIFKEYIQLLVSKNKIEYGIILDLIASGVPIKKLVREIHDLNNHYAHYFAVNYKADENLVDTIIKEMQNNKQLPQYVDYYITCLQRDEDTLEYLK